MTWKRKENSIILTGLLLFKTTSWHLAEHTFSAFVCIGSEFSSTWAHDGSSRCSEWACPCSCQCHSLPSPLCSETFKPWPKLISMITAAVAKLLLLHFKIASSTVDVGLPVTQLTANGIYYVPFVRILQNNQGISSPAIRRRTKNHCM